MIDGLLNGPKGVFVIFDYLASAFAIVAIGIILKASAGVRFDLRGYKTFFTSLVVSNLYMVIVNIVNFIYQAALPRIPSDSIASKCAANLFRSFQLVGYFSNLFNLCGMSIDHYVGILYPLQYTKLAKASRSAVVVIWLSAFCMGFADYPLTGALYLTNGTSFGSSHRTHVEPGDTVSLTNNLTVLNSFNLAVNLAKLNNDDFSDGFGSIRSSIPENFSSELQTNRTLLLEIAAGAISPINSVVRIPPAYTAEYDLAGLSPSEIEEILNFVKNATLTNKPLNKTNGTMIAIWSYDDVDFCRYHTANKIVLECIVMALTLVCFILLTICYGKVFKEVRNVANISGRTLRKLVATTFLLLATFTFCWLPFMGVEFNGLIWVTFFTKPNLTSASSNWFYVVNNISNSMMIFYPFFDAIVYMARMRVIRRRILHQYARYFPCLSRLIAKLSANTTATTANYRAAHRSSIDYGGGSSGERRSALRQEMLPFIYRTNNPTPVVASGNNVRRINSSNNTTSPRNNNGHSTIIPPFGKQLSDSMAQRSKICDSVVIIK